MPMFTRTAFTLHLRPHTPNSPNVLPVPEHSSTTKRIPMVAPASTSNEFKFKFNPEIHEYRRARCARCQNTKKPGAGDCFWPKMGGNCIRCKKDKSRCTIPKAKSKSAGANVDQTEDEEEDVYVPKDLPAPRAPDAPKFPPTPKHTGATKRVSKDSLEESQVHYHQSKHVARPPAKKIHMIEISDDEDSKEFSTALQATHSHKPSSHSAAQQSSKPPPTSPPFPSKSSKLSAASSSTSELSMFLEVNASVESLSRSFAEEISALQALQKARKRNHSEIVRLLQIGRDYLARGASKGAIPNEIFTRFEATVVDLLKMMSDGLVGGPEVIELQQVVAKLRKMVSSSSVSGNSSLRN